VIHDHEQVADNPLQETEAWPAFHMADQVNGSICCYADDSTLTITGSDHATLSNKLSTKYNIISEFMINNRLKLNDEKTHLLVMSIGQARVRTQTCNMVELRTATENIKPSRNEKLLGCWVQDDFKWYDHLRDGEESLIRSLTTRLSALKKVARISSFKNRKMLANGIFISKLSYLIALWGGCGTGLMRSLQIIQNKVARVVTRLDWSTPTRVILNQCGWLSVYQLAFYHSVLITYKVKLNHTPRYLDSMFTWSYEVNTRQAASGQIRQTGRPRLDITKDSFRYRAADQYNQLPIEVRNSENLRTFKFKAKAWIQDNIPLRSCDFFF
jgi:hypothetical protein